MGTFGGHALPGSFFLFFGLWWTWSAFRKYYECRRRNTQFTSTATFPFTCLCGRFKDWPMEPMLKIFFVSVGFSLEILTGTRDGHFVAIGNGQHATMFFLFGLTGVMDVLIHFRVPLPPSMDYVSMALALGVEGLLFKFHLHDRAPMDVQVHTFLIYGVFANFIAILAEMKYRHHILGVTFRAYFIIVQGTWFWHVAFILYPPFGMEEWNEEDHEQMMLVTIFFSWHLGGVFLVQLAIGGFVAFLSRRSGGGCLDDQYVMKRLIHTDSNGQTMVALNDESDSDIEFQKPLTH